MKRDQGFTLLEMVIVCLVVGIITVTAAPRFLGLTDDARYAMLQNLKSNLRTSVDIFHGKWMIDGEPDPNVSDGEWGYLISNLHFNKYGYPRIIAELQECEHILQSLLPDSTFLQENALEISIVGDSLDGNKCVYALTSSSFELTYSETSGQFAIGPNLK
ncbi:type II secretion system protein [Photobacterium sp. TY1-4]|uniref:type II secretion system protein n=1 Tax=Photobacterium sp. TY1-4 TaxID=2899122 RepID=UPI0021BF7E2B|nr:type II secretion system protein [Photobacterium sp. TY1-4]UXI02764.1 type II secretion system GspH family protein [Photobacterium sp. TY1-4]